LDGFCAGFFPWTVCVVCSTGRERQIFRRHCHGSVVDQSQKTGLASGIFMSRTLADRRTLMNGRNPLSCHVWPMKT
jgi:hypothetical protein